MSFLKSILFETLVFKALQVVLQVALGLEIRQFRTWEKASIRTESPIFAAQR